MSTNLCPICSSPTFANGDCVAMHKHGILAAHVIVLPEKLEEYYQRESRIKGKCIGNLIVEDLVRLGVE